MPQSWNNTIALNITVWSIDLNWESQLPLNHEKQAQNNRMFCLNTFAHLLYLKMVQYVQ